MSANPNISSNPFAQGNMKRNETSLWERLSKFFETFPPRRPKIRSSPSYGDKLGAQPFKFMMKKVSREDRNKVGGLSLTLIKVLGNEHDQMQQAVIHHSFNLSGKGADSGMGGMGGMGGMMGGIPPLAYSASLMLGGPEGSIVIEGISTENYHVNAGMTFFDKKLRYNALYKSDTDSTNHEFKYRGEDYVLHGQLSNISVEGLLDGNLDNIGYYAEYLQKVNRSTDLGVRIERDEKTRESQLFFSHVYQPKPSARIVSELKRKTIAPEAKCEYVSRFGYGEQISNSLVVETEFLYNWMTKDYSFLYGVTDRLPNDMILSVKGKENMELRTSLQTTIMGEGALFDFYSRYSPYSDDALTVGVMVQAQI